MPRSGSPSPSGSLETATQDRLPYKVRWFAAQTLKDRRKQPNQSAPRVFLEARFLAGVFESAKIGSVELILSWFTYLLEAQDLAMPKIFDVAVREGHVHLLQWLLVRGSLQDERMIANAPNTNASVV